MVTKIEILNFVEYKYLYNKYLHTHRFHLHRLLNPMQQNPQNSPTFQQKMKVENEKIEFF